MDKANKGLKRFLLRTAIGGIPVACFLCAVAYYSLEIRPSLSGDLGELGKIQMDPAYTARMYQPVCAGQMLERYEQGDTVWPVVTIGDSFSQQEPNAYSNFLGNKLGHKVTNITVNEKLSSPEQTVADLLYSGFFDSHPQVEWVIVETVERGLVGRWSELEFDRKVSQVPFIYRSEYDELHRSRLQTRIGEMFSQGADWIMLSLGLDENPVRYAKLSAELFSLKGKERDLYFYYADLDKLDATDDELRQIVDNMESLHARLAERGIRLLILPAPDKYELYQDFVENNPYPKKLLGRQLTEAFASLDYVVNPLPQLQQMLRDGRRDLYMADDSHWSSESASLAADMLFEKMK